MMLTKKQGNGLEDKLLLTACKQYCLAAGATQGNIAYTQTVSRQFGETCENLIN